MRKMDEMEMKISLNSIKWVWLFNIIALSVWNSYDLIKTGGVKLPFYLLISQGIIYFFATQIAKRKAGDESGTKAIFWYLIAVIMCLIGFGALLLFIDK